MSIMTAVKLKKYKNNINKLNLNDYIVFIFSISIIFLLILVLLDFDYGRDQGIFSTVARAMLNGGAPYKDVWDFKTPGIYFIYAIEYAIFGAGETYLRIFEVLNILLLFYGFIILSKRVFRTPWAAVFPSLIATINYVLSGFWYTAQPETFAATTLTWAIVFATYVNKSHSIVDKRKLYFAWVCAAALYSFSGLLKPPLGGGIITSFFIIIYMQHLLHDKSQSISKIIIPVLTGFFLGGFIPVFLTLLYLFITDSAKEFYQLIFVYLPHYSSLTLLEESFVYTFFKASFMLLQQNSLLHLLGLLLLISLPRFNDKERIYMFHILGAMFFSLIGIALQAKLFRYHFAATASLSGLLAGWGIWKLWMCIRETKAVYFPMIVMFTILGVFPLVVLEEWQASFTRLRSIFDQTNKEEISFKLNSMPESNAKGNHLVAEWIAKNTPEQSSIFVWGFEPSIYLYANRNQASRYIYNVAQRTPWSKKEAEIELMAELEKAKPAAVVIEEGDIFKKVTGNTKDSRTALLDFPELQQWLEINYQSAIKIENMEILTIK